MSTREPENEAGRLAALAALDDAATAIAGRIVSGTELEPTDVGSLGYAVWCVAAARDNLTARRREPHRAKIDPHDTGG